MLLLILLFHTLSAVSVFDKLVSTVAGDNELTSIYYSFDSFDIKDRLFKFKETTATDIFNSMKTFGFGCTEGEFAYDLLETPNDLEENKNKLWLKSKRSLVVHSPTVSPSVNLVDYINFENISLDNDLSFIMFSTHENFPAKGYTVNKITNEFGSALYIVGGELYSKKDNIYTISNSFYKYNFISNEWVDMTYSAEGKLKPLCDHNSVVIDKRYLVILGGREPVTYNSKTSIYDSGNREFEYKSLYNLTIFDTFTNNWENINIRPDIFYTVVASFQFSKILTAVYKDKIIVVGGIAKDKKLKSVFVNSHLGILDLKSKNWTWTPIINEDGSVYNLVNVDAEVIVFNDQLIILNNIFSGEYTTPIMIYDMLSKRMKFTLRLPDKLNDIGTDKEKNLRQEHLEILLAYKIVLIFVGCASLLLVLIYLIYKINKISKFKNGKVKYSGPIQEVWADPDIDNTNNIITFNKLSSSSSLKFNRLEPNTLLHIN